MNYWTTFAPNNRLSTITINVIGLLLADIFLTKAGNKSQCV